jgi:hypothetical protein
MNCRHCNEPLQRCHQHTPGDGCRGWRHARTGSHVCYVPRVAEPEPDAAEPEPGQPARSMLVHLITGDLHLACGHGGKDRASSYLAEVTCTACKAAA